MKELYGKAASAEHSWGKEADHDTAVKRKGDLSRAAAASNIEQWAVNKAVHYNEWANFSKKDFEPVRMHLRTSCSAFAVELVNPGYTFPPRGIPESLRCSCNAVHFNLKAKPKAAFPDR